MVTRYHKQQIIFSSLDAIQLLRNAGAWCLTRISHCK